MYNLYFYQIPELTSNVKRKNGWPYNHLLTKEMVKNGNSGNLQLHVANTIDVSTNITDLTRMTHMRIEIDDNFSQICEIEQLVYVNDNNTAVMYSVDYYHTAHYNNAIVSARGLLKRSHITTSSSPSFVNLASESIGFNTVERSYGARTIDFNNAEQTFTGTNPLNNAYWTRGYCLVLTVSDFLLATQGLNRGDAFTQDPSPQTGIQSVSEIPSQSNAPFAHAGGFYTGVPLVFLTPTAFDNFVTELLSTPTGFATNLTEFGLDGTDIRTYVNRNATNNIDNYTETAPNIYERDVYSIRLINPNDFINCQIIPLNFANQNVNTPTYGVEIGDWHDLSNVTGMGGLDVSYGKLLSYPYTSYRVSTQFGYELELIPQVFMRRDGVWTNTLTVPVVLRYFGGDNPKLVAVFVKSLSEETTLTTGSVNKMITVRMYPSVNFVINGTNNHINMIEMQTQRKIETDVAIYKQEANSGFFSSITQAFRGNNNLGLGAGFSQRIGQAVGGLARDTYNLIRGANAADTTSNQTFVTRGDQQIQQANASNILASVQNVITGGGHQASINELAFSVTTRGASNGELWGVGQFFNRQGQTCVVEHTNPFDGEATIWGGLATTTTRNGRNFYLFGDFDVEVTLPQIYKEMIIDTMLRGVYLIA